MTLNEYLEKFESMTFELLENNEVITDEIDHIFDRVESTFYYVVSSKAEDKEWGTLEERGIK